MPSTASVLMPALLQRRREAEAQRQALGRLTQALTLRQPALTSLGSELERRRADITKRRALAAKIGSGMRTLPAHKKSAAFDLYRRLMTSGSNHEQIDAEWNSLASQPQPSAIATMVENAPPGALVWLAQLLKATTPVDTNRAPGSSKSQ
jgi:hypothetical protein